MSSTYLISSNFSAYYLKFIIKRSRLCLDFSLTCHLIQLLTVSIYNKEFPLNFVWWTVTILSAWLMTEKSRSLCIKTELLPIGTSGGIAVRTNSKTKISPSSIFQKLFKRRKSSSDSTGDSNSTNPLNPK